MFWDDRKKASEPRAEPEARPWVQERLTEDLYHAMEDARLALRPALEALEALRALAQSCDRAEYWRAKRNLHDASLTPPEGDIAHVNPLDSLNQISALSDRIDRLERRLERHARLLKIGPWSGQADL